MVREGAFCDALAVLGGDPARVSLSRIELHELHESISDAGRIATLRLLQGAKQFPDAIFAFNDEVAIGAMAAVRELGQSVPEDIAVAGFDDSYIAQLVWPPLTTIHQPIADLAFQAVGIIADPDGFDPDHPLLQTKLVIRGTS
jgi:LacI family transcriptional regulator